MVILRGAWIALQVVVCLACLGVVIALDVVGVRRCPGRSRFPAHPS